MTQYVAIAPHLPQLLRQLVGPIRSSEWGQLIRPLISRACAGSRLWYGLPPAISGMNSNWLRGYGDPPPQAVIMVGMDPDFMERNFASCTWAAHLTNRYGVVNQTIGKYSEVYLCGEPRQGWPEFWKSFQYYG